MFSCEVDVDAFSEVGNFGGDHVGWLVCHINFAAVLASPTGNVFSDFPATVV
jgi:hypothetical protein